MKNNKKTMITVLAVYFLIIGNSAVTPALQSIIQAFPNASISSVYLILTIPTLFSIPASMISGMVTGRKVKYKSMALAGMVIFTVAGVIPFVLNSVNAILISRAVFGIGIGFLNPIGNSLAILYYGPREGSGVIGYGNTSMNLGGILLQMLGGVLCGLGWRYTFLAYLLGIIPIVVSFVFMKEPPHIELKEEKKVPLPGKVYLLGFFLMLCQLFTYPLFLNLSIIIETDIPGGSAAISGILLSAVTIAGMVIGAVFGKVFKLMGRFTLSVGLIIGIVGLFLVYYAKTLPGIAFACVLCGLYNTLFMCSVMAEVGMQVPTELVSKASGTAMSMYCFAPILATVYASLVSTIPGTNPTRFIFLTGAAGEVVLLVIWTLTHMKKVQISE